MKDLPFVAVLGNLAYWKVSNLRGVNAGLEFKSTPRNQIHLSFSNLQTVTGDRFHPPQSSQIQCSQ